MSKNAIFPTIRSLPCQEKILLQILQQSPNFYERNVMPGRKRKDKITQENYETLERKKNTSMNLLSILKISIQRSYYSKFLGNLTSSCHNISPPSFYWQLYLLKNILFCFYLYLFEHFDTLFLGFIDISSTIAPLCTAWKVF